MKKTILSVAVPFFLNASFWTDEIIQKDRVQIYNALNQDCKLKVDRLAQTDAIEAVHKLVTGCA